MVPGLVALVLAAPTAAPSVAVEKVTADDGINAAAVRAALDAHLASAIQCLSPDPSVLRGDLAETDVTVGEDGALVEPAKLLLWFDDKGAVLPDSHTTGTLLDRECVRGLLPAWAMPRGKAGTAVATLRVSSRLQAHAEAARRIRAELDGVCSRFRAARGDNAGKRLREAFTSALQADPVAHVRGALTRALERLSQPARAEDDGFVHAATSSLTRLAWGAGEAPFCPAAVEAALELAIPAPALPREVLARSLDAVGGRLGTCRTLTPRSDERWADGRVVIRIASDDEGKVVEAHVAGNHVEEHCVARLVDDVTLPPTKSGSSDARTRRSESAAVDRFPARAKAATSWVALRYAPARQEIEEARTRLRSEAARLCTPEGRKAAQEKADARVQTPEVAELVANVGRVEAAEAVQVLESFVPELTGEPFSCPR